eukprot:6475988-Amphidinium_carterae.2
MSSTVSGLLDTCTRRTMALRPSALRNLAPTASHTHGTASKTPYSIFKSRDHRICNRNHLD